jgi:hypothetical protein
MQAQSYALFPTMFAVFDFNVCDKEEYMMKYVNTAQNKSQQQSNNMNLCSII